MKRLDLIFLVVNAIILVSYVLFLHETIPGPLIVAICIGVEVTRFVTRYGLGRLVQG